MSPRTKSCSICRKKRMKCDATPPHCLMCIRFGRQCPGLDDGPLIVDMTKTAQYGMKKRKKKKVIPDYALALHLDAIPQQASMDRISQQATVTEAFYAHFLAYFTSTGEGKDIRNQTSWLHRLPQISLDGTNDALALAVQATASSYCAIETRNPALTRHAWHLYGRAIKTHSRFLARSRKDTSTITVHMISTSVLFSFFEAMQATSASAYRTHIFGAAKMFEVTDPRQCNEGVLCQIFFHIRTQMAFVQLTSGGEKAPVDVMRILHRALDYLELPVFQRLTSHFTKLADIYGDMNGEAGQLSVDVEECAAIKEAVDELWCEYVETASVDGEVISWQDQSSNTIHYRDAFTALTIAYFSATRVLLGIVAPYLPNDDPTDHHQSILQASQFTETRSIGCAYMRIAAPLLLAALHAPNVTQRAKAVEHFERWKLGSMRGISALALERITRRRRKTTPLKNDIIL